jgi:transposase
MPTREEVQDRSGAHRLRGETNKKSDWFCTFNIEYDADTSGETPIGVDIGERHILVVTAYGEDESMLISDHLSRRSRRGLSVDSRSIHYTVEGE